MTITYRAGQAGGAFADNVTSVAKAYAGNVTASANGLLPIGGWKWSPSADPILAADLTKSAGTATISTPARDNHVENLYNGTNQLCTGNFSSVVSGSGSLTVTLGGAVAGSYMGIGVDEIVSSVGAITLKASGGTNTSTGNSAAPTSGSVTSGVNGDSIKVAVMTTNNSGGNNAIGHDGTFNEQFKVEDGANSQPGSMITKVVGASTAGAATWTTVSDNWAASIAMYEEPASSGITATFTPTEGADTSSSGATNAIASALARTEGADALAAAGAAAIAGAIAKTEGADTLSSAASSTIAAALVKTESSDTIASTAAAAIAAASVQTEGADALTAAAQVGIAAVLARTEGADTLAAAGSAAITAQFAITEGADIFAAAATQPGSGITATLNITEDADTLASLAANKIAAVLAVTESADSLTADANSGAPRVATMTITEGADVMAAVAQGLPAVVVPSTPGGGGIVIGRRPRQKPFIPLPEEPEPLLVHHVATFSLFEDADVFSAAATMGPTKRQLQNARTLQLLMLS